MTIAHFSMEPIMRIARFNTLVALSLVFTFAACGGGDDSGEDAAEGGATTGDPAATGVDPAQAAVITGTVRFAGTAPAPAAIDMAEEQQCATKHSTPPTSQEVVVNNGMLRNVFVYVKEGLPQQSWPQSGDAPVLDQDGCVYIPHVMGVRTGQEFIIRNSDPVLHNVNAAPAANRTFNVGQPREGMETRRAFTQKEVMIPVTCQVHGWMNMYIGVLDHPYFAVTGDDGTFRIEGLPPGTYTVEAWHEKYGTQTMSVTVAAQQTGTADFSFSAATATAVPLGKPIDLHNHATPAVHTAHGQR
jgi:hypothetical protein